MSDYTRLLWVVSTLVLIGHVKAQVAVVTTTAAAAVVTTTTTAGPVRLLLGDFCTTDASCAIANAKCDLANAYTATKTCQCPSLYVEVLNTTSNEKECYKRLYSVQDGNCTTCETNGGRCYDHDEDGAYDGCVCPATRASSDPNDPTTSCDTNYVTVQCSKKQMTVCYNGTSSFIYLKNRYSESRCQFSSSLVVAGVAPLPRCVQLSLVANELSICGTKTYTAGRRLVTYENTVIVPGTGTGSRSADDIEFNAFCNFDLLVQTFSGSISLLGKGAIHSEGENVQPDLEMRITDNHRRDVATTGIFMGSKARIIINMTDARDTYQAVLPDTCVASNKPSLTTAGVRSLLLIYNGCPSSAQKHIKKENTFKHESADSMSLVEAGPFPMFKVDDSEFVYFHCTVKVCRDSAECAAPKCEPPAPPTGRRRRSVEDAVAMIVARSKRAVSGQVAFIKSVDSAAIRVFNSEKEFRAYEQRQGEKDCSWGACLTTAQLAGIVAAVCIAGLLAVAAPTALARKHAQAANAPEPNNVSLTRVTRINKSFRFPKLYSYGYPTPAASNA